MPRFESLDRSRRRKEAERCLGNDYRLLTSAATNERFMGCRQIAGHARRDHEPKAPASWTHSKRFAPVRDLEPGATAFGVRGACSHFCHRVMGSHLDFKIAHRGLEPCSRRRKEAEWCLGNEYRLLTSAATNERFMGCRQIAGNVPRDPEPKAPASWTHSRRFAKFRDLEPGATAFGVRGACSRCCCWVMNRRARRDLDMR